MITIVNLVQRTIQELVTSTEIVEGVQQQIQHLVDRTILDEVIEIRDEPQTNVPEENLIDEEAMHLADDPGEIPGGTSIADAVTEYVGGGGDHTDNCVDFAVHTVLALPEGMDAEIQIFGEGDDGHAYVVINGQAYDPFALKPVDLPEGEPTAVVTRDELEQLVAAGEKALMDPNATTQSVTDAVVGLGTDLKIEGIEITANQAGTVFTDAASVNAAIANGDSLVGARFEFDIDGIEFGTVDLTGAVFTGSVSNADFAESNLTNARFEGTVYNTDFWRPVPEDPAENYPGANLTGAVFVGDVIRSRLYNTDLTNTVFEGSVSGQSQFIGASLNGTRFEGNVSNTTFEYASFSNATFAGLVSDTDFFSATGLASTTFGLGAPDPQSNSFIGTDLSTTPMIPGLDLDGVGDQIEAATGRTLEDLAATGELFDALASVIGEEALAGALPSAWRTVLYDNHHATYAGSDDYFPLKRYIFDAADDRYSEYGADRPAGGATLDFLYNLQYTEVVSGNTVRPFQAIIDQTLLNMLQSDDPAVALDAPWGTSVPSLYPSRFLDGSATGRSFDDWSSYLASDTIQYNGAFYTRDRIPLSDAQIGAARGALSGAELDLFESMVSDGNVNVADLREAGLDPALRALWAYFGGV